MKYLVIKLLRNAIVIFLVAYLILNGIDAIGLEENVQYFIKRLVLMIGFIASLFYVVDPVAKHLKNVKT